MIQEVALYGGYSEDPETVKIYLIEGLCESI